MGRKAKLKRRKRGRLDARLEDLCRFTRTTDSTETAVALAMGAVNSVAAYLDPSLAEAASDVVALIEDLLDSRHLDMHVMVDVLLETAHVLRWPARPTLERTLERAEVAAATVRSGERTRRAGQVVLHAARAALDAEAGAFALASEHAGDAVQLSLGLMPKRELRQLFEDPLGPDPATSELLAGDTLHASSCCPCC